MVLIVTLLAATASAQTDPAPATPTETDAPTADPLLIRLADLTAALTPGQRPYLDLQTGHLGAEQSVYYDLRIEPSACYTLVAVGDSSLADLDLHVYAGGVEVAAHTGVDNTPVVAWCNDVLDRVSAELRAYSGTGRFVFQVLTSDGGPSGLRAELQAALEARAGQLADGFRPASSPVEGALPTNGRDRFEILLAGGRTYLIVATGVATATDLDLVLFDAQGRPELDADLASDAVPALRYRVGAENGGRFVLEVVMAAGYGEYLVGVYSD